MIKKISIVLLIAFCMIAFSIPAIGLYLKYGLDNKEDYVTLNYLFSDDEFEVKNDTCNFKSYDPGDVISIKGKVKEIEKRSFKIPIYNDSAPMKWDVTNNTYKYLGVMIDSYYFSMNLSSENEFSVGSTVIVKVKIEYYEHIPFLDDNWKGEFVDAIYPCWLEIRSLYIGKISKQNVSINPEIYKISSEITELSISNISNIIDPDWTTRRCERQYVRINLYRDDLRIDQIQNNNCYYLPRELWYYRGGHVIDSEMGYFNITLRSYTDISSSDNLTIKKLNEDNSEYRLDFVWKITYPEKGYDKERVIGSLSWRM